MGREKRELGGGQAPPPSESHRERGPQTAGLQTSTGYGLKQTIGTLRWAVRSRGRRPVRVLARPHRGGVRAPPLPRGALRTARAESQRRSPVCDWARRGTGRYRPTYARVRTHNPPLEHRLIWSQANGQVVSLYAAAAKRHTDTRATWTPRTRVQRRRAVDLAEHPGR